MIDLLSVINTIYHFLHAIHVEYIITILSAILIYLRFAPITGNIRVLIYAVQAGLFIAQMYSIYHKLQKERNLPSPTPKLFVAGVAQHYLKTNPNGQEIAKQSDIDDEIDQMCEIELKSEAQAPGVG